MPNVFDRYGLKRIVNVSGTETIKGASPVCPEVIEAVGQSVPPVCVATARKVRRFSA